VAQSIPRIFHQVWIGEDPIPDEYLAFQQGWLDHHPGWELRFWTEDHLPESLRRPEARERLRVPSERSNILRFEVLWQWGGVYVDTDFECLRSIEPLLDGVEFCTAYIERDRVNGAFIGAVPGHPIVDRLVDELQPREFYGHDKRATGSLFFDSVVKRFPDAVIFDQELFYGKDRDALHPEAYAFHHRGDSWKTVKDYKYAAEKAQRSAEKAREREQEWRARYERAEAELARLRRTSPSFLLQRLLARARAG
jgi:inositol phosphorylceramide mannosyltransferase catalytic subunit